MFSEDDHRDITFGIVVVAVVVVTLIVVARLRDPTPRASREVSAHISDEIAPDSPEQEQVADKSRASQRTIATVYECPIGNERIVSDRPCGPNAEIREIAAPNLMVSPDTSHLFLSPSQGNAVSSPRASNGGSSIPVNAAACDAIQRQIDAINARMRQKYTNREGEHYRERLRDLSDARWDANCRWRKK